MKRSKKLFTALLVTLLLILGCASVNAWHVMCPICGDEADILKGEEVSSGYRYTCKCTNPDCGASFEVTIPH